jgi:hypothetical protein
MAIPKNDKRKEYPRYAFYSLNMEAAVADRESPLQRQIAAEWLKLAGNVRRRPRSMQMQGIRLSPADGADVGRR